jgi:hypothetical protein
MAVEKDHFGWCFDRLCEKWLICAIYIFVIAFYGKFHVKSETATITVSVYMIWLLEYLFLTLQGEYQTDGQNTY